MISCRDTIDLAVAVAFTKQHQNCKLTTTTKLNAMQRQNLLFLFYFLECELILFKNMSQMNFIKKYIYITILSVDKNNNKHKNSL